MFLLPPTRAMRAFSKTGLRVGAANPTVPTQAAAKTFVSAYDEVRRRDDRTCRDCHRSFLEAPNLRLWVKDPAQPHHAAQNLEMLCVTCCSKREAALMPAAAPVTGIDVDVVLTREGRRCCYCHSTRDLTVVPRTDRPAADDVNDWACSCVRCAEDRASRSHADYTETAMQNAFDLWSFLREEVEVMRGA